MEKKVFRAKTVELALKEASVYFGVETSSLLYSIQDEGSRGFLGFNSKDALVEVELLPQKLQVEDKIVKFLAPIFDGMSISPSISVSEKEGTVFVDVDGDDVGILIGHHGETMYALQYLLSLAVNKNQDIYYKIVLNIASYREKRKEALEILAKNKANRCRERGRYAFEPMNASERRIIHMALENENDIETYSEGKEPTRRVILVYKGNEN